MTTEKPSKIREIKETIFGAVEIVRQVKDHEVQESFGQIMDTAKVAKEIIEALKTPEMVKNIENFRLISENVSNATEKIQDTIQQMEDTGIIDETKELIKSAKSTMNLVSNTGQDLREISLAFKDIFRSIRGAQDTIHDVREKYRRADSASEITVMPHEVENYLSLGWQYIGTLQNGMVIIRKKARHEVIMDWTTDLLQPY